MGFIQAKHLSKRLFRWIHRPVHLNLWLILFTSVPPSLIAIQFSQLIYTETVSKLLMLTSFEARILIFTLLTCLISQITLYRLKLGGLAWMIALFGHLYSFLSFYLFKITGLSAARNLAMLRQGGQGLKTTLITILPAVFRNFKYSLLFFFSLSFFICILKPLRSYTIPLKPRRILQTLFFFIGDRAVRTMGKSTVQKSKQLAN